MMRKSSLAFGLFCFLVIGLFGGWPRAISAQQAQQVSGTPTREDRVKVFDQVWRAIYDNYYDKSFRGVDWRQQREVFRPQIESAASSAEFYRLLRQMIGKLGDAHTRIYAPEDGFDRYRPAGLTVGLVVRRIEGRPIVTWVEPDSEAAKFGIRPGFAVSEVDGEPVEKVLRRMRTDIGESSTATALELQSFDRIFYGPRDVPVAVTFVDEEGRRKSFSLTRRYSEFQRRVTARQLPYKIGYIELTGFGPEIERDFDAAMQQMQGTRGLILDLRNNGGGFVTTVTQIASYFFTDETDLGEFITRFGRSTHRRTRALRNVYRAPLIVLVSSRSASGSEIFAAAMQEQKRGVILGTNPTTCGCLLGVSRTLRLSDGGKLNISDTDYRTALGRRIEGLGVRPDRQVELRIADLMAGRDRTLEEAVDSLGRTIAFGPRNAGLDFRLRVPEFHPHSFSGAQQSFQLQR
jgi:C-terminal peptidase prc